MSQTQSPSTIVTSISDFDSLVAVAKKHGLTYLRVGDIEFHVPITQTAQDAKPEYTRTEQPDVNAAAFDAYRNL